MSKTVLNYEPLIFLQKKLTKKLSFRISKEILSLKKERNAIILAHNYQIEAIQEVADFVGDSLGLSYKAEEADADIIVFCGVHFMAETAKIVNPNKTVLLPDLDAGCSLSDACPAEQLKAYKEKHPDVYVVAYINCSAGVKALSDVICTSGNAQKIVDQVPGDKKYYSYPIRILGNGYPSKLIAKWSLARLMLCACSIHFQRSQKNKRSISKSTHRSSSRMCTNRSRVCQ